MSKIKFTKGELKRQRDSLKQFRHYLPTLQLKKQQLQMKILEARKVMEERRSILLEKEKEIERWIGLLADSQGLSNAKDFKQWITPSQILLDKINIAGATIPIFNNIHFPEAQYSFYSTPLWVDRAIEELRLMVTLLAEIEVIKKQIAVLERELRITTQRVNLFEKIKIPECLENIRKIRIYLGDQMANAVGISKVAKGKVEIRSLEEALV